MLARGALCRLAAGVPKTSTHDLPRVSQLLQTAIADRSGAFRPTVGAIVRAFRATILEGRRTYATKTATESTPKVKKDVKKAAAKKPAAKKSAARKTTAETPAKKAAPKKRTAKKPATTRKRLTPEQKEKALALKEKAVIKELKVKALTPPPKRRIVAASGAFMQEYLLKSNGNTRGREVWKEAWAKYSELTPAEREHYNHQATQAKATEQAEYKKWLLSHTPEEIRAANFARAALRRRGVGKGTHRYVNIQDDRIEKTKATGYSRFVQERFATGDFKGIQPKEAIKLVGSEWRALSDSEKKKYDAVTA